MLLMFFPHFYSASMRFFFEGAGMSQLLTYAGITLLACIGYGAFFIVVGLFFRNPIIPSLMLYGWEWINFLLPASPEESQRHSLFELAGAGAGL